MAPAPFIDHGCVFSDHLFPPSLGTARIVLRILLETNFEMRVDFKRPPKSARAI
jgi:hypothetical protein